ncbi:MAG: MASE1 domain-containing protein [Gallionella sp.]|nr:MASE1 domain-containing protein [Gallionella sp.]
MPTNNFTDSNTLTGWLKQLGIAALYALLIYVGELYFDSDIVVGYFEPASGLALAALLLGGKRYALGLLLGATLVRTISEDSLWEAAIISLVDTLQALCGAWLLTRDGKFDSRLQSLRDYLRLILLGGYASIAIGTLAVNTTLLISGALHTGDYFHSLIQWWMSDTLGVILITPLILVWWSERDNRREAGKIAETVLLFGLTILAGQAVFLDWWHDAIGPVAQGYWMFLITTWAAVRLGIRETVIVLLMTAVYALLGAIWGVGFFADDIIQSQLVNYWFYMLTLSVVGMALATYFAERKQAEVELRIASAAFESQESMLITDADGVILRVNQAFTEATGYTSEEGRGSDTTPAQVRPPGRGLLS